MAQVASKLPTAVDEVRADATTEQLSMQINSLKADMADIASTLRSLGVQRVDQATDAARAKADAAAAAGRDAAHEARLAAERLGENMSSSIKDRPFTAIAIAAGVGLAVGFLSGRK
ncbi:DUF883 family protein [Paroceanicella profunda]|uniref:DUF883 family protein n=1 Tax=Paroceanicella profunda TaxID=2579971 RepID=A0A5B8FYS9_9RHOB|nr:DUF883 C-terminal domain-containing protein [Paroceanicella profunda]QDL91732.1 DUF883 family protein [Paroceanicella profunda]